MNTNDLVPSRSTIAREIARQAGDIRQHLGVKLKNAAKQGFLSISPDLWSDKFKQNSYLGLTAHFTDEDHALHSIVLCCEPYNEIDKRGDSVRKVSNTIEPKIYFSFFFLLYSIGDYVCSFSIWTS